MRDLSALTEAALASEEGKMFWFMELQFDSIVRYTDCDLELWAETTISGVKEKYEPMSFSLPRINYNAGSSVDKLVIEIQNVDLTMAATLLNEDVMNKWGVVYVGFYNDDNVIIDNLIEVFRGLVSTWSLNESKASMTLVNEFVFWNKKTLRTHQSSCRWRFKGDECTYSGTENWCDQGYTRCHALNNRSNFGGFRWLPELMEKEIYWGRTTS